MVDERGDALPDVAVRVEGVGAHVAVSDAFGAFRFDDLAPGDYRDPGWYAAPPGTVARRVSSDRSFGKPVRRR